jgi:asparagine synthase (glutamine-hydrolysing)
MRGNALTRLLRGLRFLYVNHRKTGVTENAVQKAMQARWPVASIVSPTWEHHYQLKSAYDESSQFTRGYHNIDKFVVDYTLSPHFIGARVEECTLMASSYGVEMAYPLLDVELIQCYLSIPSNEKYHQGKNRYLHRRAVSKHVPDCTASRHNKDTGPRVASYHPKAFKLNDDLHPALREIIQKEKLWHQSQQLKNAMPQDLENPLLRQARQNIYDVNALDHWLKYFYPNGCDWQV